MPDEKLSRSQHAAVSHEAGAMLLLASPGSGKTFTLVRRVLHLIMKGRVLPEKILVLTFTRAAAQEMQSRFLSLTDGAYRETVFGTFHAVYYHILHSIPQYRDFHLTSQQQRERAIQEILGRHDWPVKNDGLTRRALLEEISRRKRLAALAPLTGTAASLAAGAFMLPEADWKRLLAEYRELCRFHGWLDFDDLILCSLQALQGQETVRQFWQGCFTHILVDEFQDISPLQYEVLKLLAHPQDNLFAVGDDDQSIYGFRGAAPSVMRQFLEDFPGAVRLEMSENFRSARMIVKASDCVIRENRDRFDKHMTAASESTGRVELKAFGSREEEALWLCGKLSGLSAAELEDTAVIVRTHALAGQLADIFLQEGIPFACREPVKSFYEKPAVKDVLAYLRLAKGERKRELFLQIMNRPVRCLDRELLDEPAISLENLRKKSQSKPYLQEILRNLEMDLARLAKMTPEKAVIFVRKRIGYDGWLREQCTETEEWEARKRELEELELRARRFDSMDRWLTHVLDCRRFEQEGKEKRRAEKRKAGVQLMTLHACKGLEFHTVFLPGLNEGTVPYRKAVTEAALEEERRLFYVGMTRAKKELYLSFQKAGPDALRPPSRFLLPLFNLLRPS